MKVIFKLLPFRRITRAEVLNIAQAHAESRGWPWLDPVDLTMGLFTARVWTNAEYKGGNVFVRVCLQTGEVKKSGFANR